MCPNAECKRPLNDRDVKNLNLDPELVKLYEKVSLENAISQMEDMGWCPLSSCQ